MWSGGIARKKGDQQMEIRSIADAERMDLAVLTEIDQNSVNVGKKMGEGVMSDF